MKSAHKNIPRREALNKYVRAKAHREGTLYKEALQTIVFTENGTNAFIPLPRGKNYDSPRELRCLERLAKAPAYDRQSHSLIIDEEEDTISEATTPHRTDMTVNILKIARPAKGKGVAKDFEVVRKVRNVVALPEAIHSIQDEDDWERIYDEEKLDTRPSYSSVARGSRKGDYT